MHTEGRQAALTADRRMRETHMAVTAGRQPVGETHMTVTVSRQQDRADPRRNL